MPSISVVTRNRKIIGYRTSLGRGPNGKDRRSYFKTHAEAKAYIDSVMSDRIGTGELFNRRAEIVFCLQKVTEVNATLYEAVDFFVKHGAKKGNPIIEDVVQEFLKDKQQVGRKGKYLEGLQDKWTKFIDHVGEGKHLADITTEKIRDYIFVTRKELSDTTKSDYLRGLSILFNYGIKKKYLSLNPVVGVERPQLKYRPPEVLSPEDFTSLLNRCLKRKWFDRLTVFILVGFCGVRTEEACQLRWDNIDMSAKKVLVPAEIAKKAHFRRNGIPSNAMKWLKLCHDRRKTGPIIGANAKQQLSTAIRFAHIGYTQNCLRHSFCSYSLESGIPLADVAASLGHTESLQVLHTHYRNIVEPKTAKAWWAIVP